MVAIDPLRRDLVAEMHLRPTPIAIPPARLRQYLFFFEQGDVAQALRQWGLAGESAGRFGETHIGEAECLWEQHTEAATVTLVLPDSMDCTAAEEAIARIEGFGGRLLRAIAVEITNDPAKAESRRCEMDLDTHQTVAGRAGGVSFWSNFKLYEEDGYGRLLVLANKTASADTGRIVQQLQELGNYRNLALLSLGTIREAMPVLAEQENALAAVTSQLSGAANQRATLEELTRISARVAELRSATFYRLNASFAYGTIVGERLESLSPEPIDGFQTLSEFTNRRLLPALRTFENFTQRIEALSLRIEQATALLRARIETELQHQNAELLQSLTETAKTQLHLQRLVEGLSIFAVAYYALGLLNYALGIWSEEADQAHRLLGYAVLPMVVLIAIGLRWKQRDGL